MSKEKIYEVANEDIVLPKSNVMKIMRLGLPEKFKISGDAIETMQECLSEFIKFITSEASEKCNEEKKKTMTGEDIINAMIILGFDNYSELLRDYLNKYRNDKRLSINKE